MVKFLSHKIRLMRTCERGLAPTYPMVVHLHRANISVIPAYILLINIMTIIISESFKAHNKYGDKSYWNFKIVEAFASLCVGSFISIVPYISKEESIFMTYIQKLCFQGCLPYKYLPDAQKFYMDASSVWFSILKLWCYFLLEFSLGKIWVSHILYIYLICIMK